MVTVSKKEHHDQQLLPNRQAVIGFYVILFVLLGVLVNSRWLFGSDDNTSSGSSTHPSQASGFQRQANTILQHTVDQGLLTTELSQREFVLANGFPSQWQWPLCLLDGILQAKTTTTSELNVAILGGSTSARAAYNCDKYNVGNPVEGRYSNILQQLVRAQENKLQQEESAFRINFQNLAQGSTNSLYSAMHMDTLLLPNETDVVIWDHGPDDDQILTKHNFGGETEELRRLEFWFTRLKALYGQAGKPPPPIIVLRWWRRTWWSRKTHGPTLDSNQMDYLGPLFSHLQGLGFDIAVVNVGAAIPWTSRFRSKESHRLVSDDGLHPSCSGATFAAQMLEHLLYSNWGNGTESCGGAAPSRTVMKQPMKHNNNNVSWSPQDQLLWEDLFREDAKLGSINSWEPKQRLTGLHVENAQEIATWDTTSIGKVDAQREDHKYDYRAHTCLEGNSTIILSEPDLKWLGFDFRNGITARLSINNQPVFPSPVTNSMWPVTHWLSLPEQKVAKADKYVISICSEVPNGAFGFIVALAVPHSSNQE